MSVLVADIKRDSVFRLGIFKSAFIFAGVFAVAWAILDPRFRDWEGFINARFCLPFAAGLALVISGLLFSWKLRKFIFWFILGVVGQAVSLSLIDAGPYIRYQHYKSLSSIFSDTHIFFLIWIVIQATFVLVRLKKEWPRLQRWRQENFKVWHCVVIFLFVCFSSATVSSRNIAPYLLELTFASFIQFVNLGNLLFMVWSIPDETVSSVRNRLAGLIQEKRHLVICAVGAAAWVVVLSSGLSWLSYDRHPHIPDEVVYLYQARYFASGMLAMPVPPVPEAFKIWMMEFDSGGWYAVTPPGWPAILSLGVLTGTPWLVNPVSAGVNILLAYYLLQHLYDKRSAALAVSLLAVSPWYVFMGMNFMTHTCSLTFALIGAAAVVRARQTASSVWGWIGGASTGIVSLIRPLEAVIVAILLGLWSLGFGGKRLKSSCIIGLVVGCIGVGSIQLLYNHSLTGSATKFPFTRYFDKYYGPNTNTIGFGAERGLIETDPWGNRTNGVLFDPLPGHGLLDIAINAHFNMFSLTTELFGWATGSVIALVVILFSGAMRQGDYLMAIAIIGVVIINSLYWASGGPDFGARYWYLMIIPCVALAVSSVRHLSKTLVKGGTCGFRVPIGVFLLCLSSLLNYFPWRAIDKYHNYRLYRADVRKMAKMHDFGRSLVLVNGNAIDYSSAAIYNPMNLSDDGPIYAWDKSIHIRQRLLEAFSERKVWLVDGPSIMHARSSWPYPRPDRARYTIVAGPLSRNAIESLGFQFRP